ncbi:hypothetical protein BV898_10877 [Hypsibius exemplaris]|uniref:Uncharacterized protein n=1 Tax=Hypsibius exemplaris TaxID=2072580 RepID=A0A1W0WIG5_HYPEX|nr:hypothetical protein BV898_10877 [Hypsibius exemplaris]
MASKYIVALCLTYLCVTFAQAAPARRVARELNLNSIMSGLATQFFNNGGQRGVNELANSDNKPNVLQKYLAPALMSGLLGGGGGGGSGSGNSGFNMNHPIVQQLIQMIMAKFSGGGGGSNNNGGLGGNSNSNGGLGGNSRSASAPQGNAYTLPDEDGQQQQQQPKQKSSGSGAGAAILKMVAKQLLKA